jgi:hypothetical protein
MLACTICIEHNHTHLVMANILLTTRKLYTHVCAYMSIHVQHVFVYMCAHMYIAIYFHTRTHTYKAQSCCQKTRIHTNIHIYTHTHFIPDYMSGTRFYVRACSHLRRMQRAICTWPAITNMSHMHSTASATC